MLLIEILRRAQLSWRKTRGMTKVIKQTDLVSCVACVGAMATNTTLTDFQNFFGSKPPPYSDIDFYRYLLSKGYTIGVGYSHKESRTFVDKHTGLKIHFRLEEYPAYVIVESMRFKGMKHVVYWDGEKILDSNPKIKGDGLSVNEYKILAWFPIIKFWVDGERVLKDTKEEKKNE